jgi:hypothetical protein
VGCECEGPGIVQVVMARGLFFRRRTKNNQIMNMGLYSSSDPLAFRSKAGAMSFALVMSLSVSENGDKVVDYEKTKKLFDFICENVNLPDVEKDATAEVVEMLSAAVKELQKEKS